MIARNHYRSLSSCALLSTVLMGCSGSCTSGSAEGTYSMSASAHIYELRLAPGGLGTLSRDGRAENISWEWENKQVFLNVAGDLARDLLVISVPPSVRDTVAKSDRAYLGLVTKCSSGLAKRLDLRQGDDPPHFSRSE
jgi:hypothetical protein